MVVPGIEILEGIQVIPRAFLQLVPVLEQVDVFQSVVVGVDIVFVGALTDVQHAAVFAVDIDDGRLPCLPVQVGILCHSALHDGISVVEIVEVVARVAEHEALEFRETGFLVGEEFVAEPFLAETLVGIDSQRFQWVRACGSALDARFAKLVEGTFIPIHFEILEIDGTPPVELKVLFAALIGSVYIDSYLRVVQIPVVGGDAYHGQRQFAVSGEEDVALGNGAG